MIPEIMLGKIIVLAVQQLHVSYIKLILLNKHSQRIHDIARVIKRRSSRDLLRDLLHVCVCVCKPTYIRAYMYASWIHQIRYFYFRPTVHMYKTKQCKIMYTN